MFLFLSFKIDLFEVVFMDVEDFSRGFSLDFENELSHAGCDNCNQKDTGKRPFRNVLLR